jgi:NitT/TauT family transport system substrate-binding protein
MPSTQPLSESRSPLRSGRPARRGRRRPARIAWSIYVGWMPWGSRTADAGIVDKWADKYGIEIEVVQINDYIESINQYTAGGFDGCVMTNMDALTIPAAGGVDSTALIVGDFSNGNDAVVLEGQDDLARSIAGQEVNLVELSVSHYLLARALDTVGLSERDITVVNTSDADLVGAFTAGPALALVVTWNPMLSEILAMPEARPGLRLQPDPRARSSIMMVVNTKTCWKRTRSSARPWWAPGTRSWRIMTEVTTRPASPPAPPWP